MNDLTYNSKLLRQRIIIVDKTARSVNGKIAVYKLLMHHNNGIKNFSVCIEYAGECTRRTVSCSSVKAGKVYSLIVNKFVTPCTLDDVISDLEFHD